MQSQCILLHNNTHYSRTTSMNAAICVFFIYKIMQASIQIAPPTDRHAIWNIIVDDAMDKSQDVVADISPRLILHWSIMRYMFSKIEIAKPMAQRTETRGLHP